MIPIKTKYQFEYNSRRATRLPYLKLAGRNFCKSERRCVKLPESKMAATTPATANNSKAERTQQHGRQ